MIDLLSQWFLPGLFEAGTKYQCILFVLHKLTLIILVKKDHNNLCFQCTIHFQPPFYNNFTFYLGFSRMFKNRIYRRIHDGFKLRSIDDNFNEYLFFYTIATDDFSIRYRNGNNRPIEGSPTIIRPGLYHTIQNKRKPYETIPNQTKYH